MEEDNDAPEFPESSGQPPRAEPEPKKQSKQKATVEDAFSAAREFATDHMTVAFGTFGLYAALTLIGSMLGVVVSFTTGIAEMQLQQMNMSPAQMNDPSVAMDMMVKTLPALGVSVVYGIVANGFYAAMFRPARRAMMGDSSPGLGVAVGQIGSSFGKGVLAVILLGLIVGFGAVFCLLPGVVAYFFLIPYFYIVCGKGESVIDGLGESYEWAKENVGVVITVFIVQVVLIFGASCIQGATSRPILEAMGKNGIIVTSGVSWVAMTLLTLPVWLLVVGAMSSIERARAA
jgi:hypothetical protein